MQESGENYLETIYLLSQKKQGVHALDVAKALNFSKPSVTRAMGILKNRGFIIIDELKHIILTDKGLSKAKEIHERHEIIEAFFIKLGVSKEIATKDACRVEHDISEETFEAIKKFVDG
ncbi:MAG: metal-dependent transcriptional regulator [Firmicutes bacterium]|nr:metal-dependent transcriptional regulator [Bacillota bacterium]